MRPGSHLFGANHQAYNVVVTAHGLTMIFFHDYAGVDRRLWQLVHPADDR